MFVLELRFALWFLDAIADDVPGAADQMRRLAGIIPPSGSLPVPGGTADEKLRPLDFTPVPNRPLRTLFAADAVAADLEQLAGEQRPDGGWTGRLRLGIAGAEREWRSYATVRAITILRAHGAVS